MNEELTINREFIALVGAFSYMLHTIDGSLKNKLRVIDIDLVIDNLKNMISLLEKLKKVHAND